MIAPLDIVVSHCGEHVEYLARTRTAVKDVAYYMQRVDGERMNEITDHYQQLFGAACLDDGIDDGVVVGLPVVLFQVGLVEQFFDDIRVVRRQQFVHFRPAVFDSHGTGYVHHLVQPFAVPRLHVRLHGTFVLDALVGIIDERTQRPFLVLCERVAIHFIHFLAHYAGRILDHMDERQRVAVQVTHEMLGTFGQREDGAEVDDLRYHRLRVRKLLA